MLRQVIASLRARYRTLDLPGGKFGSGNPVTAPGVPRNYPDAKKLMTEDCIKPAGL